MELAVSFFVPRDVASPIAPVSLPPSPPYRPFPAPSASLPGRRPPSLLTFTPHHRRRRAASVRHEIQPAVLQPPSMSTEKAYTPAPAASYTSPAPHLPCRLQFNDAVPHHLMYVFTFAHYYYLAFGYVPTVSKRSTPYNGFLELAGDSVKLVHTISSHYINQYSILQSQKESICIELEGTHES
jgi:hypothetical protein